MERFQTTEEVEGVQDMDAYAEACAVFGDAGAQARLRVFREELVKNLSRFGQDPPESTVLRDMAHRTAGRAGLFGFAALAHASATLDEAARRNSAIALALDHWREQAVRAIEDPTTDS